MLRRRYYDQTLNVRSDDAETSIEACKRESRSIQAAAEAAAAAAATATAAAAAATAATVAATIATPSEAIASPASRSRPSLHSPRARIN